MKLLNEIDLIKEKRFRPYCVFDIETTGLYPAVGDCITAICAVNVNRKGQRKVLKISQKDEADLLTHFKYFIKEVANESIFVTFYGLRFDVPFFLLRGASADVSRLSVYNQSEEVKRLTDPKNHFDISISIEGMRGSLNDVAKNLGIDMQKTGENWKMPELARQWRYEEIAEYCMNDVLMTEKIFLELMKRAEDKRKEDGHE